MKELRTLNNKTGQLVSEFREIPFLIIQTSAGYFVNLSKRKGEKK